ncbi:MAG: hypothetical protein EOO61_13750 [Hymenobacter sp.]|nr:MAG: hypothetical protein EOO61_13750 [Hymenobacter sp.]
METIFSFDQLKAQFPDEWLLLENPEFKNAKPVKGVLLAHGKDYLKLCYESAAIAKGRKKAIVFTGEPKTNNRKWLRAIRLNDPTKTA